MRLSRKIRLVVSILALGASAGFVRAQESAESVNIPDFTAIQLLGMKGKALPEKVYQSGSSVRVEVSPAIAVLYITSSKMVYRLTVYPDKKKECVSMTREKATGLPSPLELLQGANVQRTPAGSEEMEGHKCKVENVVVTKPDGTTVKSKVWEAEDLKGVPVQIESQTEHGKLLAVYRDIALGTPDKALFTVPDGCIPREKMSHVVEQKTLQ